MSPQFICLCLDVCLGQINRPPAFLPGSDMNNFNLSENTPVGTQVYTLRGLDPDGTRVHYYISGDTFSVDKDTGAVKLIKQLDREKEPILDVVVTIIDEKFLNKKANTISHQREIKILDFNDNKPTFGGTPYRFSLSEATKPFALVFDNVFVTDADAGQNAQSKITN